MPFFVWLRLKPGVGLYNLKGIKRTSLDSSFINSEPHSLNLLRVFVLNNPTNKITMITLMRALFRDVLESSAYFSHGDVHAYVDVDGNVRMKRSWPS